MQPDYESRTTSELLHGVISDAINLMLAHARDIQEGVKDRSSELSDMVVYGALAAATGCISAIFVGIALMLTIHLTGIPLWACAWIVVGVTGLIVFALMYRVARLKHSRLFRSKHVPELRAISPEIFR